MRALLQRVKSANVKVNNRVVGEIDRGMLVFLGITHDDTEKDIHYLVEKIINLRIFENEQGKLDHSISDIKGEILLVSQFTLYGECDKGRRPDFTRAAPTAVAIDLYEKAVEQFKKTGCKIATGEFQAHMMVNLINDGPLTLMIESKKK